MIALRRQMPRRALLQRGRRESTARRGGHVTAQTFMGPLAALFATDDPAAELSAILLPPTEALPVPAASDRSAWSAVDPGTVKDLVARAERDLSVPWPLPLASQAVRVHRDGDRDTWERLA